MSKELAAMDEKLYQAIKKRLLSELLVDVHGTTHYGKLVDSQHCPKCGGTGWIHGVQDWTPSRMSRGTPYRSEKCLCK